MNAGKTAESLKLLSGAARQIDDAIADLTTAQKALRDLQLIVYDANDASDLRLTPHEIWHCLEAIDDRIHDALSKLGN